MSYIINQSLMNKLPVCFYLNHVSFMQYTLLQKKLVNCGGQIISHPQLCNISTSNQFYSAQDSLELSPKGLYKYLLKECNKLPIEAQSYYKHNLRQGFYQHADEVDPERINQIISRAISDGKWVVKKYSKTTEKKN